MADKKNQLVPPVDVDRGPGGLLRQESRMILPEEVPADSPGDPAPPPDDPPPPAGPVADDPPADGS